MNVKSLDIDIITDFLRTTFQQSGKKRGVIAVSGGIDSAVSCTLLAQALEVESVFPVLLPYGDQSTEDSMVLLDWLQIPESNRRLINIKPVVEELSKLTEINSGMLKQVQHDETDQNIEIPDRVRNDDNGAQDDVKTIRLGNLMARSRMILLYDVAREVDGLVCGTENKSEKYLGYFTRFGDEASDIEPIQHLYKTQVRKVAVELGVPAQILQKPPTAGLWLGQTDETELGFSYEDTDRVLAVIVDRQPEILDRLLKTESDVDQISQEIIKGLFEAIEFEVIQKVLYRVKGQWFKQEVPHQVSAH